MRYKPVECSLFPLEKNDRGEWFVRQKGFAREDWDLACLDPAASGCAAADSLVEELKLAEAWEADPEGVLGFPS